MVAKATTKSFARKTLPPVKPNRGSQALYREALQKMIDRMAKQVEREIEALYKANEPKMGMDELPSVALERSIRKMSRLWRTRFNEMGPKLAKYFATKANKRVTSQLKTALKEGGMTVKFTMTRKMQDVMNASINEQVELISNIPEKYFTDIQGAVMRSVQAGRDLGPLSLHLQKAHGMSFKRASLISRDQNNKATAVMARARHEELGIEKAIWMHSHAGKVPRPTHLANDGKVFNIKEGWVDPDVGYAIWPGELINCRCTSRPIIPGFD